MEDIGGFFAVLRMSTDDASFQKGIGALQNVSTILKGFAVLKIGEGMMQLLDAMSKINETQALLNTTADQIGVSTIELKNWQIMADMVGGSADGMAKSLKGLMDITANLGRGITPDNQKFIDMLGVLGVTKWQGVSSTDLAQNMLDNAMQKIRQYRERGDKVGEARIRNAVDAMLGPSGNALLTAGLTQGWTTQQMLGKAGSTMMTNAGQMRGAVGPMVDMNLFSETVKESEKLFAMKFMASVDPELKQFLAYVTSNKSEITTTLNDLASVFGAMAREMLGFLKVMVEGAVFVDKLFHGKVDRKLLSQMGQDFADLLIPKSLQDFLNSSAPLAPANSSGFDTSGRLPLIPPSLWDRLARGGYLEPGKVHAYPGQDRGGSGMRLTIDLTPDAKRALLPTSHGIENLKRSAETLWESGG